MSILEKVNSPADLKRLGISELETYAEEVRQYIIETVEKNGGHLASNLGAVDFTIALHYVFDCPKDKIIFDVGHQAYAHKIITGRRDVFSELRKQGGITGFPNRNESEYDAFTTGHSSTSLSVGLGMARARDLKGEDYHVVSVIGDGALTGGMAYEALNDIGASGARMIIILNDNAMSISKNVGAMSAYLGKLRLSKRYKFAKNTLKRGIDGLPIVGPTCMRLAERVKGWLKKQLISNKMFEQLGIKYYGVFDGHNIAETIGLLRKVKNENKPVLLHLTTNKGSGMYEAEKDPEKFHGVDATDVCRRAVKFSAVVGEELTALAEKDDKIVAVTAAMAAGTGLSAFEKRFPQRFFDVGIAEQHAVSMCAGLAAEGCKPYFAVYSSFLQRGFDQILHDVCISKLPVRFLIDRAGAVGADGVTHQGLFDLSYLSCLPNMTVLAPRNGEDLRRMLRWSVGFDAPLAIRYPKDFERDEPVAEVDFPHWEKIGEGNEPVTVLAVGARMTEIARHSGCTVYSARFVKPLDTDLLDGLGRERNPIVTMEENVLCGGFGESVRRYLAKIGSKTQTVCLGYDDVFCDDLSLRSSLLSAGLSAENLLKIVANAKLLNQNS